MTPSNERDLMSMARWLTIGVSTIALVAIVHVVFKIVAELYKH